MAIKIIFLLLKSFSILAILLFIGCAQTLYTHPTKDVQDFARDKYECEQIMLQRGTVMGSGGDPSLYVLMFGREDMDRCLREKFGWKPQKQ